MTNTLHRPLGPVVTPAMLADFNVAAPKTTAPRRIMAALRELYAAYRTCKICGVTGHIPDRVGPEACLAAAEAEASENGVIASYVDHEGCPTEVITHAEWERRIQERWDASHPPRPDSCPQWCEAEHAEDDAHSGEPTTIELQTDPATSKYMGALDTPVTVIAQMVTGGETRGTCDEPVVQLDHDSIRTWVELSMDEAEELGLTLLTMVKASRQAA